MKRGKKFLLYIFSITFCCLFIFFFVDKKVEALDNTAFSFSCIDRNRMDTVCDEYTGDFYYRLDSVNVSDEEASTLKQLVIPSTFNDTVNGEGNVEEIASNVINSLAPLNLDILTLPSHLTRLSNSSLTNIASLKEISIPTTTQYIGENIFGDSSSVEKIYINEYEYASFEFIEIASNAFTNANVGKIICGDHGVYNYFATDEESALKDFPNLVATVTYVYYMSENETLIQQKAVKTYYVGNGQTISEICENLNVEGLNFLGWYVKISGVYKKVELNGTVHYNIGISSYNVYPRFELTSLNFNVTAVDVNGANASKIKYDGSHNLVELDTDNYSHALINNNAFSKTIKWYKVLENGDASEISDEESVYLSSVSQTGTYKAVVTYAYNYDGLTYEGTAEKSRTITITKAPLYVSVADVTKTYGEYLNDSNVQYEITGLLNNDKLETSSVVYSYTKAGKINVGNYTNDIKVEIKSIKEGTEEKIANYDIVYSYGNYIVEAKVIDAYFDEIKDVQYGEAIVISKTYEYSNVYGDLEDEVVVTFNKAAGVNVGEYGITGVKDISDSNYKAVYNTVKSNGKVIVSPRKVETHFQIDSFIYDGRARNIDVYYLDVNNVKIYVDFIYVSGGETVSEVINAGNYSVSVESLGNANYDFYDDTYKTISFSVEKANPVATYNSYQMYTYNGARINPRVTINNSEQTPVYQCLQGGLQGDYCVNAGSYSVVVNYPESDNYKEYTTNAIRLDISKKIVYLTPRNFSFYFNEYIDAKETIEIDGETVVVKYNTNALKGSELGKYDITGAIIQNQSNGSDHHNYLASIIRDECVGKIDIVSRPITIVYYNYADLVYNGKERVVGAYAVDNLSKKVVTDLTLTIECDEGIIKDAKTYHLRAYFENDLYVATNSNLLTFTIAKATYDVSNLKFNDKEFTLDFKDHSIYVEGDLPEGVSVKYTIDDVEGNSASSAFSHKVVASFVIDTQNYLPIENMEATLYIDMSWVFVTVAIVIMLAGIALCGVLLYAKYRREHPKKIKLKIKNLVQEDLESKRVASSVKEVLGDDVVEHEVIENDDDIIEDGEVTQNFIDRIYAADSEVKYYYSEVKNELLSYDGIKHSVDRKYEVFYHGTRQVAKLSICNGVLKLYVNLDPDKYDKKQYDHRDMSKFECHARTPLRIDVDTTESLRHAKVFIRILRKKENLKAVSSFVKIDYEKFYTLKENFLPRIFKKMSSGNKKKEKK